MAFAMMVSMLFMTTGFAHRRFLRGVGRRLLGRVLLRESRTGNCQAQNQRA